MRDSLALARKFGQPSFFITMTCNPNWPEITSQLRPAQTATDSPIVVVRAFKGRLKMLLEILRSKFGTVVYLIYVIEFQKRGLPHAHIILKTDPEVPFDNIDDIISAEMPPENQPEFRRKVQSYMLHRPQHSPRCLNAQGRCIYNYPKPLTPNTIPDDRGYVQYRRRHEDDRWVVPYNRFLLKSLDCHINVEISSTVNVFMYLYKYLYKGPDQTAYNLRRINDDQEYTTANEIEDYISARYISAPEAAWRILGYQITDKDPSVQCLPIHLPNANISRYSSRAGAGAPSLSLLERYLLYRPRDPIFDNLTYTQYFETYTLNPDPPEIVLRDGVSVYREEPPQQYQGPQQNLRNVRTRIRGVKICRLDYVALNQGERFYLRCIIQIKPARSFQQLRTINGVIYETYQEAARALGLFNNMNEATIVMQEAVDGLRTPAQLRFLFVQLIYNGSHAQELWIQFKDSLMLDYLDRCHGNEDRSQNLTLISIASILQDYGRTLSDYGLPNPVEILMTEAQYEIDLYINRRPHLINTATEKRCMMNNDQGDLFDRIMEDVRQIFENPVHIPINHLRFIEGKAGRGKTFLINAICEMVRGLGGIALPCGTTALAASNYTGGRTAHSLFGIPVESNPSPADGLTSTIATNSIRSDLLKNATIIIWDEVPMAHKSAFECVDVLLREICNNTQVPFGGKFIITLGDFRQVAPVVRNGGKAAIIQASVKNSHIWPNFVKSELIQPIRNASDPLFANLVDAIGEDQIPDPASSILLPSLQNTPNLDVATAFLFPPNILATPQACAFRSFLSPLNVKVDLFNAHILEGLPTESKTYYSSNSIREQEENDHSIHDLDFLNNLSFPGIPNHQLDLKVNSICCLMRNMSIKEGLVKNARVVVVEMATHHIKVALIRSGTNDITNTDYHFCLPRIIFYFSPPNTSWTVERKQFPLRLAYATTFNSCQGLTLDRVVLDMTVPVFSHGQLYTAISRVRNRQHLLFYINEDFDLDNTVNVVYRELIQ